MKRRAYVEVPMFLMCFLAAFLSVSVQAQAQEKIRIGISSSSPGFLPTVVAEQKGFFTKYGLGVRAYSNFPVGGDECARYRRLGLCHYHGARYRRRDKRCSGKAPHDDSGQAGFFSYDRPGIQQVTDLRNKTIGISYFGSTTHLGGRRHRDAATAWFREKTFICCRAAMTMDGLLLLKPAGSTR